MLKFVNKHKGLSVLIVLTLILFIIIFVIFASLFSINGESKYGNRLDGIEEVKLTKSFLKDVEKSLEEDESVVGATVRLQGKTVYIVFEVKSDISEATAQLIASKTLEKFSTEELAFYDLCYIVNWKEIVEEKEVITAIEGTKHHSKENITW